MKHLRKKHYTQHGMALIGVFVLFGLVAFSGYVITKRTNFFQKASTSCETITSPATCTKTSGCDWKISACSTFSSGNCPTKWCNLTENVFECSKLTSEADCKKYAKGPTDPGYGCDITYTRSYCTGQTDKDNKYCQNNGYDFCSKHSQRCKWMPPKFDKCYGKYTNGTSSCTQKFDSTPPSFCSRCAVVCKPGSCDPRNPNNICSANGCGYVVNTSGATCYR